MSGELAGAGLTPLLLDVGRLLQVVPLSRATLGRMVAAGTFPAPIYIGRRRAWRMRDVQAWADAQAANPAPPPPHPRPARACPGQLRRAARRAS